MKPRNPPSTEYAFGYTEQPASGNAINGLGETNRGRARHVFHNATGGTLPFDALDDFFGYINPWSVVRHMLANAWQLRRQDGPVAPKRISATDPAAMAETIKSAARSRCAELVGVTAVPDIALYEGRDTPFKFAICLGLSMSRDAMVHVPQEPAAVEVMRSGGVRCRNRSGIGGRRRQLS